MCCPRSPHVSSIFWFAIICVLETVPKTGLLNISESDPTLTCAPSNVSSVRIKNKQTNKQKTKQDKNKQTYKQKHEV